MRIGLLKRSVIALLALALAGVWQIAPSSASQPCNTINGTTLRASPSADARHCEAIPCNCAKSTICCQISLNLLGSYVSSVAPIDWHRVIYSGGARTIAGRRLAPELHPPTTRV